MSVLERLKLSLNKSMEQLAQSPYLEQVLAPGVADKRLYLMYMVETYHYTRHNTRNQALVATRDEDLDPRYMKFCLKHAEEEAGHELMALHDIRAMGLTLEASEMPKPLNTTSVLIAYLYRTAQHAHPVARLGYSFWAERVYDYIRPLLGMASGELGIPKSAMTFFHEHATIDQDHARQVDTAIERFVQDESALLEVENCLTTSLFLTARMMDEVFENFLLAKAGAPTRYDLLLNRLEKK